jgi:thiamine kinase-like enzyme
MPDHVITDIGQLTVDWLTLVLIRSGALRMGTVRDFDAHLLDSTNARFAAIRPVYSSDAAGSPPTQLLLKMCADNGALFGPSEVHYYTQDYGQLAHPPIPPSYDAQYSAAPRRYHVLMKDLSATHRPNWNTTPTVAYGYAVADALARLHAHWWGEQRLRVAGTAIPGEAEISRYHTHIQPGLTPILDAVRDEIDATWQGTLYDIFQHHPARMIERTRDRTGFTIVHGDVNPGNILSPHDEHDMTYLIDRQPFDWSLTTWLAVSDMAYFLVLWWDTDLRRRWELPILQHYHARLVQYGVQDYSWEQLIRDYKLTAVEGLYVAVEWGVCDDFIPHKWIWWPKLCRAMAAFSDLDCAALWAKQ